MAAGREAEREGGRESARVREGDKGKRVTERERETKKKE